MMRRRAILIALGCLAMAVPALAQVSANYDLRWHVVAGGGGRMESAGGHTLIGTAGQQVVGPIASSGHTLCSDFWCGSVAARRDAHLPLIMKNHSG